MSTIKLEDAQARLQEVIAAMIPGESLVITKDGEPVANLTLTECKQLSCKAGSAKSKIYWMAPDFNAPLEDFPESME